MAVNISGQDRYSQKNLVGSKSLGLSHDGPLDKDKWRLRIKEATQRANQGLPPYPYPYIRLKRR